MIREFLETVVTIAVLLTVLSCCVWCLGKFSGFLSSSFGVQDTVIFFLAGFSVGCLKGPIARWMLDLADRVHSRIIDISRKL